MRISLTKKEVLEKLGLPPESELEVTDYLKYTVINGPEGLGSKSKTLIVDFPSKTTKEIVDECDNKVAGGKLLWSDWMLKEDFYTKEKTREGKREIDLELVMANKSWDECNLEGKEMLNFAEVMYLLREYPKFRELLSHKNDVRWTWTISRDSDGYFVRVGGFDSDGALVLRDQSRNRHVHLGSVFSTVI